VEELDLENPRTARHHAALGQHRNIEKIVFIAGQDMEDSLGHCTLHLGRVDIDQAPEERIATLHAAASVDKSGSNVEVSRGMAAGQWWMIDGALVHSAGPNRSTTHRVLLCLTYLSPQSKEGHGVTNLDVVSFPLEKRRLTAAQLMGLDLPQQEALLKDYEDYLERTGQEESELSVYRAWRWLIGKVEVEPATRSGRGIKLKMRPPPVQSTVST
jgi:hypothetical protein